jgi:predicted Na+-dependent transporter
MAGMKSGVRLFLVLIAIAVIAAKLGNGRAVGVEWLAVCAVAVLAIYGLTGLLWGTVRCLLFKRTQDRR